MSYWGCQPMYQPTSRSTVRQHNRRYIVQVSVKYLLTVSHYINQVTFYCQWSIGQKSVDKSSNKLGWIISVVCQMVNRWWSISKVSVVYWLTIYIACATFFSNPLSQSFSLCFKVPVNWHVMDTVTHYRLISYQIAGYFHALADISVMY